MLTKKSTIDIVMSIKGGASMENVEIKVQFRKTLYFKMIIVIFFIGITFFTATYCIYKISCNRFNEELNYYSDTLVQQVSQNIRSSLAEMSENSIPIMEINTSFGSILKSIKDENADNTYLDLRIRYQLEETISITPNINWIAIVDSREKLHLLGRNFNLEESKYAQSIAARVYLDNQEALENRQGNIVWLKSPESDNLILMRSVFDLNSMQFCGCVMVEISNQFLQEIFNSIDSEKAGNFILYDKNNQILYSTFGHGEFDSNLLTNDFSLENGKIKLTHFMDVEAGEQRFLDILNLTSMMGFVVLAVAIFLLWMMFGNTAKNMKILLNNLDEISEGNFNMQEVSFVKGEELDILAKNILKMSGKIEALMEQAGKDKEIHQMNEYKLLEMRYHELQSQVNPHFLFNILQSINGIAQINDDMQVSRLICMLSKFFRGNVDRRYTSCSMQEELEYAQNYMELYKEIYPERLNIEWSIDHSLDLVEIPTYILQPIVENSIVHGLEPMIEPCTIKISVFQQMDKIIIEIWDNGCGMKPEKLKQLLKETGQSKRVGINNVHNRIQILYGKQFGLTIKSKYQEYTEVRIKLPASKNIGKLK